MHLLHGASSAHTSTCSALRKLSPPVGLCVSASHQTRLSLKTGRQADAAKREDGIRCSESAHTLFWMQEKGAPSTLSGTRISPEDQVCKASICCDDECPLVPCPICDTAAFARSPSAGLFVCLGRAAYICEG